MENINSYDDFVNKLETEFPEMFSGKYGGVCVGEGWWTIIYSLCKNIHHHITENKKTREVLLKNNPYNHRIPEEVSQVVVEQIKEKFGGLRFYYYGGDNTIDGMVRMAESWSYKTCEICGNSGKIRGGGWLRTLCEDH